ncbi:MAG: hypothetical protein ACETWC_10255 [Acidobacteriota bacterium]
MKGQDLYTKIVLTIIAVSLVVLVLQNFFQADSVSAEAQLSSSEVIDVNIAGIGGWRITGDGVLDVNVKNKVDVNLAEISTNDTLNVSTY